MSQPRRLTVSRAIQLSTYLKPRGWKRRRTWDRVWYEGPLGERAASLEQAYRFETARGFKPGFAVY